MSVQPSTRDTVQFSFHACKKWEDRGDDLSLHEAFALAAVVNYILPDGDPAYPGAKTFVYAPGNLDEELVFVVRDGTLVTVTPPRSRATASRNLSACPCCDGVHEFVADCGCVWCNEALEQLHRGGE
jgi:hypothetical protein